MSYNTRRNYGGHQNSPNVGNVGQRRPMQNNFNSGGPLSAQKKPVGVPPVKQDNQQQRPPNQQQAQQQKPPNQQQTPQQKSQNQQQSPQQKAQQNQQTPQQQKPQNQQQQQQQKPQQQQTPLRPPHSMTGNLKAPPQQTPPKQEPKVEPSSPANNQATPMESQSTPQQGQTTPGEQSANESMVEDGSDTPTRRPWFRKTIKISKKEKQRRRNMKLSKMLQPKNAVMILNELVKAPAFVLSDMPDGFQAIVVVDNVEHIGNGRSKNQAKNNAAENAIRHIIKNQKFKSISAPPNDEGEEKMDVEEGVGEDATLPWQHVASLALFKLFTSWNEDVRFDERIDHKPAKKIPANPELMQPLMLLNQMCPHAEFEEVGKTGTPPNLQFTFRCRVEDQVFEGSGPNKKLAKKFAAYAACHKILNVNYPATVWAPSS